jgi:HAD superfamily hydrolase (TIGR01459 family)
MSALPPATPTSSTPPFIDHFAELASGYDVILSDVWGVVHNGVVATPEAGEALTRFRAGGGRVVLITNAPRPNADVARQIEQFGVVCSAYDAIVSSGDVTRAEVAARPGQKVFHLGPQRDLPIFKGFDAPFAPIETADYVVCSGLFHDENETPDDYRDMIEQMRRRDLFMVCANPDVVVERGDELVYCAGAIADRYAAAGGKVLYAGKPYRPIYEAALKLARPDGGVDPARVLAIGDSIRTDLKGAVAFGLDCLFLTAGIHAEELGARDAPDPAVLGKLFTAAGVQPKAVATKLVW